MRTLLQDVRYAARSFRRTPGLTAVAILSIAIGIGANSAIFSVASALLLRPLPYQDADRLAILWNRSPGLNIAEDWFSTAQYFDIKTSHSGLEDVAIALGANFNLTGEGDPERVGTLRVSSNLLPMLGARPEIGRLFEPADDTPGRAGVAVLSHGTWARRYGKDRGVLGKIDDAQRAAVRDRRCPAGGIRAAARSDADARRRRRRRDLSAAAARRQRRDDPDARGLQHPREAEAAASASPRRKPRWRRSRPGFDATSRTSIRRTAA